MRELVNGTPKGSTFPLALVELRVREGANMVGVSLLHRKGYFCQRLDASVGSAKNRSSGPMKKG